MYLFLSLSSFVSVSVSFSASVCICEGLCACAYSCMHPESKFYQKGLVLDDPDRETSGIKSGMKFECFAMDLIFFSN